MSKLFYDHLIILEELEHHIKSAAQTPEEKEELWNIVDEIVHHRVLGCILEGLPNEYHREFLDKFHDAPHDDTLMDYINFRTEGNVESAIKEEVNILAKELLEELLQGNPKS